MKGKQCKKCDTYKPLVDFSKLKRSSDGHAYWCRSCTKEYSDSHYKRNVKKRASQNKVWKENNLEKSKKINSDYVIKNREKLKIYRQTEKYKEYNSKRMLKFYHDSKKDPMYRLKISIRGLIAGSMKRGGFKKESRTFDILGCDYDFFMIFLGSNYNKKGMHKDHVVPVSLAKNYEEIMLLNHYSNFQMLTARENLLKGDKFIENKNLQRVLKHSTNPELVIKMIDRSNIVILKNKNLNILKNAS